MLATILLRCWFVPRAHTALNSDEQERKIHRCRRQVQAQNIQCGLLSVLVVNDPGMANVWHTYNHLLLSHLWQTSLIDYSTLC